MADEKMQDTDKTADGAAKDGQKKSKQEGAGEKAAKNKKVKAEKAEKGGKKAKKEKPPKMTRKERKALRKQQEAREKELVEAGEIPLRNKYKPRGIFWRIFGVCLAFIFGIFAALGGLVGAGAVLLGGPSENLLAKFGLEAEKFLNQEYLDKSFFEIYDEVMADVNRLGGDPGALTLNDFAKYSPMIDTSINDLVDQNLQALGIELELSDIKGVPFGNLGAYLMGGDGNYVMGEDGRYSKWSGSDGQECISYEGLISQIELGALLNLNTDVTPQKIKDNAPMYALSYGKLGVDYTIGTETSDEGTTTVVRMIGDKKPKNITDLVPSLKADNGESGSEENGNDGIMDVLGGLELGTFLGADIKLAGETEESGNAMIFALCYGSKGLDYDYEPLKDENGAVIEGTEIVTVLHPEKVASVDKLLNESTDFINGLPLGEMLGLNTAEKVKERDKNSMIYSICYGTEGTDYDVENDLIVMRDGHAERTLGDMTGNSDEIINGLYVDSVLDVKPGSEAIIRTIAYGNEMPKGEDGEYLKDEDGNYLKVKVLDENGEETDQWQYEGGGKYIIEGTGESAKIVMLPDPNDPENKPYEKRTIGDLTAEDANLIGGITLGSILDIGPDSSGIMKAIKGWTIDDLSDQAKIESLQIGDILDIAPNEDGSKPEDLSNIMWALKDMTIADLRDQNSINGLKLSDVLEIDENSSSGILRAIKEWTLEDLGRQNRIERLKLGQILNIDEDSPDAPGIMKAMKDWRISYLTDQDMIDSLTLGEILTIDGEAPQMLHALRDMSLGEISTGIDTLTLEDVLGKEAFAGGESESNKILEFLRYTQIKDIATEIQKITVDDLFGDDMWSYAKAENYQATERPAENIKLQPGEKVNEKYFHENTELTGGYYKADGTKVTEDDVRQKSYVETKVFVTRITEYYIVDYDKAPSEWTEKYTGAEEVQHDDFSDYYEDEAGKRHDLEPKYTYMKDDEEVTGKKILEDEAAADENEKYYYIEKTPVTYKYAAEDGTLYTEDQITIKYYNNDTEYTRYYSGVWYLLFGDAEDDAEGDAADRKFTEMGSLVTGVTGKINSLTLGDMYIHELIDEDPSTDISELVKLAPDVSELKDKTNLNQLTVNDVISLIKAIAENSSILKK